MITGEYFERLVEWKNNGDNRELKIELESARHGGKVSIWAYDYGLGYGQHVKYPEIPNIEAKAEENDRRRYRELRERFGDE